MAVGGAGARGPPGPGGGGKGYGTQIGGIGRGGGGLARIQNFVVFVPGTKVGDQVKVRITKVHRRMAFGEVVND